MPAMTRFVPPVALMAIIFLLSAQPDLSSGLGFWDLILRKIAHMAVFGLLALLWWRALAPHTRRPLLLAIVITLLYAVSDEYHQTFVGGRSGSPVDVLIDTTGVTIAVLAVKRVWPDFPEGRPGRPRR